MEDGELIYIKSIPDLEINHTETNTIIRKTNGEIKMEKLIKSLRVINKNGEEVFLCKFNINGDETYAKSIRYTSQVKEEWHEYDNNNNCIKYFAHIDGVLQKDSVTIRDYNGKNQVIRLKNLFHEEWFRYDINDLLVSSKDNDGSESFYEYSGNVCTSKITKNLCGDIIEKLDYDLHSNLIYKYFRHNSLRADHNLIIETWYDYDENNNLVLKDNRKNSLSSSDIFKYKDIRVRYNITKSDIQIFRYDDEGRLIKVVDSNNTTLLSVKYKKKQTIIKNSKEKYVIEIGDDGKAIRYTISDTLNVIDDFRILYNHYSDDSIFDCDMIQPILYPHLIKL